MPRGKGIYKRGTVWWIRYAGPDGRIRYESSRSSKHQVAEVKLAERRKAVQDGIDPTPAIARAAKTTLRELADHYLVWAERQRSFRSKKGFVKLLVDEFGNLPLGRFTTRLIEEYQTKLIGTPTNNGKKRQPSTSNRYLATLKHMFTKAVEWEMVGEEALRKIRRAKLLEENNRRLRYLSADEAQSLIAACSPSLSPIVITALNTGMRKEEILSLEWEKNLDLVHGFILLDRTKNGDRREIPINRTLRDALQGMVRRLDSPYVFTDSKGRRFRDIKQPFQAALRKTGIKDFRFHDLRHTFASHLIMSGADLPTVKELLGHKTLAMTLRYSHLAPAHKAAAISRLDDSLRAEPNYTKTIQAMKKGLTEVG